MKRLFATICICLLFISLSTSAIAYGPDPSTNNPTDCYVAGQQAKWCNWHSWQPFASRPTDPTSDWALTLLYQGYYFRARILSVYDSQGVPLNVCVGGAPAKFNDNWECDYNYYNGWFQNYDTCNGSGYVQKCLLACHPTAITVWAHPNLNPKPPPLLVMQVQDHLTNMANHYYPGNYPPLNPAPNQPNEVWYVTRNAYELDCDCP